jgi:hypothetical protein
MKPDWNELEACRDSLREHTEIVKKLRISEEYWRLLAEKNKADKERMDWLESNGGVIGIDHIGYGDYRHYAGGMFKPLRDVVDAAKTPNGEVKADAL